MSDHTDGTEGSSHGGDGLLYHLDGDIVPATDATVSVRDRGFRYGDGVFETVRIYGGEIFEWDRHADRLAESCRSLDLDHGLSGSELATRIREAVAANDFSEAAARLSITRGVQPGALTPAADPDPTVVVTVRPLERGGRHGRPVWNGPATATIAETQRVPDGAIPARAKTHNYLNGILARLEAREVGVDEALLLDGDGHLTEGATCNCFLIEDGVLRTPALDGPVLPGITRAVVLELAREAGLPVETGQCDPSDLRAADEAFLTNSTWELRPLETVQVNGETVAVGDGPVTEQLRAAFDARIEEHHYEE
jgi:branched-chain amino acid aminotransferase